MTPSLLFQRLLLFLTYLFCALKGLREAVNIFPAQDISHVYDQLFRFIFIKLMRNQMFFVLKSNFYVLSMNPK